MHKPESVLENEMYIILWDKRIIQSFTPDLVLINKKKKTCFLVDFTITVDHTEKMKGNEKRDKHLNRTRELKKLWKMRVTVMPLVVRSLGTISKGL